MKVIPLRLTSLAVCALVTLSACTGSPRLPDDPFASRATAMAMVPINHTGRYAFEVFVDKYWAGDAPPHNDGAAAACCHPGLTDWHSPSTVRWKWSEEDPKGNTPALNRETHSMLAHFPADGPHSDPDPNKDDAYVCVILRDLNTAELAFSPSRSGCADR
ncbi:hypothetical protein [Paraburkholderia caffeinilytica]|uniref:DUF3304 domain-containing protein n=1 Tax=Paraburkholderia caffeinilytica TaxID=1761016 RepID=A0ABQ1M5D9_9BURK|nr:hypothetical protein [Paraburkholderia caffeinilytica]GGC34982.1 hypothetical protein GCM10011400_22000 [Paraburkholderia caffeinilytica]CAB3794035.1 hypothetical protein LMG28690_03828 [Paraburkholderia caffeinilytica]